MEKTHTETNAKRTSPEDGSAADLIKKQKTADSEHYDEGTQLMFFSGSKDVPPGKGSSETIAVGADLSELAKLKDWRKRMSNFYQKPRHTDGSVPVLFVLDGNNWTSVEHYFQANKFKMKNPQYYRQFTAEGTIGQESGEKAKSAGRRERLSDAEIQQWNRLKHQVMFKALLAKYQQNADLAQMLLATGRAKLLHRPPRSALVVEHELMRVRSQLRSQAQSKNA